MLEWLALILLVPVVLVPIVLLFGFAGCNQVLGLDPTVPAAQTSFQAVLGADHDHRNRTLVQRIEPVRLIKGGSKVTITIQRPATGMLRLMNLFLSRASNTSDPTRDPYDSASDLTPVLDSEILVLPDASNPLVELDEIEYALDNLQPLLIAFDVGPEGHIPRTDTSVGSDASAFLGPTPPPAPEPPVYEAAFADPDADRQSGYTRQTHIYLITRIAVR
jgi:hypothetical protein